MDEDSAPDCDWRCSSDLGVHRDCPVHNPIDMIAHDQMLLVQEPIREQLRIANTTEALRNRVLAQQNGFRF